jgi:hypothetical protein
VENAMSASLMIGGLRRGGVFHAPKLRCLAGASVIALLSMVVPAAARGVKIPAIKVTAHEDATSRAHVYLMRGLLNIFSLGMDQLAAEIAHNGVDASVYNHSVADSVVGAIVQKYRAGDHGPYILVGHSLGANAVMMMAQELNAQGVPVALVVPFDGTGSYAAPSNVSCVINLTQRQYAYMQAGAGFHGKLSNVDVSSDTTIDHITIDKSPRLQAMALKEILQAAHGQSCRPGTNAPAIARSKEAPKEIAPKQIAPKEAAPKETAPAKSATPAKSASPAKSTSPEQSASPEKSVTAASRSS